MFSALILPCAYAAPPFLDNKERINIRAMVTHKMHHF